MTWELKSGSSLPQKIQHQLQNAQPNVPGTAQPHQKANLSRGHGKGALLAPCDFIRSCQSNPCSFGLGLKPSKPVPAAKAACSCCALLLSSTLSTIASIQNRLKYLPSVPLSCITSKYRHANGYKRCQTMNRACLDAHIAREECSSNLLHLKTARNRLKAWR